MAINLYKNLSIQLDNFHKRQRLGNNYYKVAKYSDCLDTILRLLEHCRPKVLYDIGASEGNWSYVMSVLNPHMNYVAMFEPQIYAYKKLISRNIKDVDKQVFNVCLGEKYSLGYIKGATASASLLKSSKEQEVYFPNSILHKKQKVKIYKLDDIVKQDRLPIPDVIKIDVQGYELKVLKGALKTIKSAKYLVIELSMRSFYNGQPSLGEVITFLEKNHYEMVSRGYEWWTYSKPNELLQLDGIFRNMKLNE